MSERASVSEIMSMNAWMSEQVDENKWKNETNTNKRINKWTKISCRLVQFHRFGCLLTEDSVQNQELFHAETVELTEELNSPRLIKSHLSLELLPRQLWTVKPKVCVIYMAY